MSPSDERLPMSRVRLMIALFIALIPLACSSSRDLSRILPGSDPFRVDRWEVGLVAVRPVNAPSIVQLDVAVQETDRIGLPSGAGVESGRKEFEVGRPFIWDRVAVAGSRTLQIVSPSSRRDGDTVELNLKIIASEGGEVVDTRTLNLRVR